MKRHLIALIAVLPMLVFVAEAHSADRSSVVDGIERWGSIPVVKDEVYFLIADGFPMAASWDSNKPGLYQTGFFPEGQSKENWKENLRLMAFQGIPKSNASPAIEMIEIVSQPVKNACPNDFFFEPKAQVDRTRASAFMGCRKMPDNPSMAIFGYYLAIQGDEGMYVLAREFRQNAFSGALPVPEVVQRQLQEQVDRTTICRRNEICINK